MRFIDFGLDLSSEQGLMQLEMDSDLNFISWCYIHAARITSYKPTNALPLSFRA